jgi:arginase family enzyme
MRAGRGARHRRDRKRNVRRAGIGVFTMRDIDERGMRTVMEEALRMAGRGTAGYHISLDMDWIDPEDAPGVGTPVRAERLIARRIWRWRSLPTTDAC